MRTNSARQPCDSRMRAHAAEGHFAGGSMGPKVEAAITFLERGGSEVLITSPANLEQAFAGT